ncbi:DUF4340 domain-containing protein [Archangium lansingense]|uniref:DUF4340 domain-containing protein n=1 Tax=Archangium lansingense TaxID=2995310 RepID=A0ABT4AE15_9BACT|nr:DUF4340 domain-containing protein [Archangium lansinium]MCY1079904.1 DUF4340 domain-containing protein [Archangium lansinium]
MNAQQKNLVTLLTVALVAGGLGLYAYFGVMQPEEKEAQRKEAEEKVFAAHSPGERDTDGGAPPEPIFTWISVELPMGKTVMERQDNTWRITSPVSALADKTEVSNLLAQLSTAKFKATLEENPTDADLERYGLKQPRASVTTRAYVPDAQGGGANDPTRQRSSTVYFGVENNFDGSVYLRREGDPRVYTAQGALRFVLQKSTNEWRERVVFPVEESSLLRIEVKARKNAFTLERATTEKPWKLVQPVELRASSEQVTKMVSALNGHRAIIFPSQEDEEKVRRALEKPLVQATFVRKLGGPVRVRITELELGGFKQTVALSEWDSESMLARVDQRALDVLDLAPKDFKDRKVLAFSVREVNHITIHPAPGSEQISLSLAPDTGKWEMAAPMVGIAQQFKVASLLGSMESLTAAAIVESNPKNWGRYGITGTSRGVTLRDATDTEVARLWIGSEVKGNPQRVWARGSSEDVLEVEKSALAALPLALTDLMDGVPGAASSP